MKIKVTPKTKIDIHLSLSFQDIQNLVEICISGLPKTIPLEMQESLESLTCLAINPLRPYMEV